MASYRVRWKKSAQKELKKLSKDLILKILEFIGNLPGDHRIVYDIKSDILTIEIIRIGHRKEIYRRLT